jgi:DNA uptake protein ComE-like DNA-binding protein
MVRRSRLVPLLLSFLIGLALQASPALAAKSKAAKVNLNTASQQELEALPGVGEAMAKKIIAARPYASVEELSTKAGVPASTVQKLKGHVTAGSASSPPASEKVATNSNAKKSTAPTKAEATTGPRASASVASSTTHKHVDVNTATLQELEAVPGIGEATAKKIVAGRPYASLSELSRVGVPDATIQKAHSYLSVSHPKKKVAPVAASTAATGASASAPPARSQASTSTAPPRAAKASPKTASSQSPETEVAPRTAPAAGMVWVNTDSKVYHYEGDRWYGRTKEGKFMTEADAIKAGYRASREGAPKAQ